MKKVGNPRINDTNVSTRITKENAREYQRRANEARKKNYAQWKSVQVMVNETAPDALLPAPVVDFWAKHGIERDRITPQMAEITPIYAAAIRDADFATLERIYRLFGLTFESNKEHNVNVVVGNKDDKPFEINYIVDGIKQNPEMVEVKQDGL